MERFFEHRPDPADDFNRELERRIDIPWSQLERTKESRVETLFHSDTNTLLIVPPTPKVITPKDLVQMSVPVIKYIYHTRPDVVIGCDRGGRLFSLAVHSTWRELSDAVGRFPTGDNMLRFARLSKSVSEWDFGDKLISTILASNQEAYRRGKKDNSDTPHYMFIDDWVATGETRRRIYSALDDYNLSGVKTSFAVMCGSGGDVTGNRNNGTVDWSDDENKIGIAYKGVKPTPTRSSDSRAIRKEIFAAAKRIRKS